MDAERLIYTEIEDVRDDLLLPWLDLYETAFPASERVLVSVLLGILKKKMAGETVHEHLVAAVDEDRNLVGMSMYSAPPGAPAALFWCLAVTPDRRNRGIGARIYQDTVQSVSAPGCRALVLEVEIPGEQDSIAQRRIGFYQRQGACLLKGIHYLQHVGWHQEPIPMHLMVHPLQPLGAQDAFDLAKGVFGDALQQVGALELE